MFATLKNNDTFFYQLKNTYFDELDNSLRTKINEIVSAVETALLAGSELHPFFVEKTKDVFVLRIEALKFFANEGNFNVLEKIDTVYPDFLEFVNHPRLTVLIENILFALRSNKRLVESIIEKDIVSSEELGKQFENIPNLTYNQYITFVSLAVPDNEMAQKMIDFTHSSLMVELSLIAADCVIDNEDKISDATINELAGLASEAAQNHAAIAYELELIETSDNSFSMALSFDQEFINEQISLADLGLEDLQNI